MVKSHVKKRQVKAFKSYQCRVTISHYYLIEINHKLSKPYKYCKSRKHINIEKETRNPFSYPFTFHKIDKLVKNLLALIFNI